MKVKIIFFLLIIKNFGVIITGTVEIINDDLSKSIYNQDYINIYKISNSLMSFQSNGGSGNDHDLSLAFDNNFDTYWNSEKFQNSTFLNNIQVTFSKTVTINRMVYQAPSLPAVKGYGYPSELKIYFKLRKPDGTLSEDDFDFLLFEDIISERTENKVVFIFDEEIICDQLKIEWVEIEAIISNYLKAHASEIIFLYPENEYINKLLYDIYDNNDYSQLTINQEYNDINLIEEIEEKLINYFDFSENVKKVIDRIKMIVNGELKYDKRREFTTDQSSESNIINQHGDLEFYSRDILKMSKGSNDRQPTGIYGFTNETIIFYVDCNEDDPLPSIYFSQYMGISGKWISSPINLKKGKNILKIGEFETKDIEVKVRSGGPIYIKNEFTKEKQSKNVKIYIEGGFLFPLFRINDNEEKFKKILNNYVNMRNNNSDTFYNIIELYSDRIMITNNATIANELYNIKNESIQKNMENWDRIIKMYLSFDGIQFEENQPYYDKRNQYINFHLRYCQPIKKGFASYASVDHIGIFLPNTLNYVLTSHINNDSVIAHEIGHMIDLNLREIPEVTNLILEEFQVRTYQNIRTMHQVIYESIAPDNINNLERHCLNEVCLGFFLNSGKYTFAFNVWWDIESFYPGYWGKLDNFYRYNKSLTTGMNKNEVMIFYTNLILGFDTGYYFERFGLAMDNKTPFNSSDTSIKYKNEMEKIINEGKIDISLHKKMWYADNLQYHYSLKNGSACYVNDKQYNIEDVNITKNESTGKYTIFLPIIDHECHLGFEIRENESVIGFTQKLEYIDKIEYPQDYTPNYKILAYDRLLNSRCIFPKKTTN